MFSKPSAISTPQTAHPIAKNHAMNLLLLPVGICTVMIFLPVSSLSFLLSSKVHYEVEGFSLTIWSQIRMTLSFLLLSFFFLRRYICLRHLEYKRQHFSPTTTRLATIPTQSDSPAFHISFIIDQKVDWLSYAKIIFCFSFIFLLVFTSPDLLGYIIWRLGINIYDFYFWLAGSLFICLVLAVGIRSYARVQFFVTENGLLKQGEFQKQFMPWHEVRLFAIDSVSMEKNNIPLFEGMHTDLSVFFELSSDKDILCWQWLRPPRWYEQQMAKPVMGYKVYEQQMQALLSIIVAKTGQPLYDLR